MVTERDLGEVLKEIFDYAQDSVPERWLQREQIENEGFFLFMGILTVQTLEAMEESDINIEASLQRIMRHSLSAWLGDA